MFFSPLIMAGLSACADFYITPQQETADTSDESCPLDYYDDVTAYSAPTIVSAMENVGDMQSVQVQLLTHKTLWNGTTQMNIQLSNVRSRVLMGDCLNQAQTAVFPVAISALLPGGSTIECPDAYSVNYIEGYVAVNQEETLLQVTYPFFESCPAHLFGLVTTPPNEPNMLYSQDYPAPRPMLVSVDAVRSTIIYCAGTPLACSAVTQAGSDPLHLWHDWIADGSDDDDWK